MNAYIVSFFLSSMMAVNGKNVKFDDSYYQLQGEWLYFLLSFNYSFQRITNSKCYSAKIAMLEGRFGQLEKKLQR